MATGDNDEVFHDTENETEDMDEGKVSVVKKAVDDGKVPPAKNTRLSTQKGKKYDELEKDELVNLLLERDADISKLQTSLNKSKNTDKRVKDLKGEKDNLQLEINRLQQDNTRIQGEKNALSNEKVNLTKEVRKLKAENKKYEDEKETLENSITQLQADKTQIQEEKNELDDDKASLTKDVWQLQVENKRYKDEKTTLENSITQLQAEKTTLQTEKTNLEKEKVEELEKVRTSKVSLEDKIAELNDEIAAKDRAIANSEELLREKTQLAEELTIDAKNAQSNVTPSAKNRVLAILDKNRDVMVNNIDQADQEWTVGRNINSVRDLQNALENDVFKKQLKKFHAILILLGGEDIVSGENGLEVGLKLTDIVNQLLRITKSKLFICLSPPVRTKLSVFAVFNSKIQEMAGRNRVCIIDTKKCYGNTPSSRLVEPDSYLLTEEGGKTLGKSLRKEILLPGEVIPLSDNEEDTKEPIQRSSTKENISTKRSEPAARGIMVEVPANMMGLILGSGGNTIRRLQRESGARIEKKTWTENDQEKTGLRVTGSEEARTKASLLINNVLDKRAQPVTSTAGNIPCKFYKSGDCWRGENCTFSHESAQTVRKNSDVYLSPLANQPSVKKLKTI